MTNSFVGGLNGAATSEFKLSAGVVSASALVNIIVGVLSAFNIVHLSEAQVTSLIQLTGLLWVVVPVLYIAARTYIKGRAMAADTQVANANAAVAINAPPESGGVSQSILSH